MEYLLLQALPGLGGYDGLYDLPPEKFDAFWMIRNIQVASEAAARKAAGSGSTPRGDLLVGH